MSHESESQRTRTTSPGRQSVSQTPQQAGDPSGAAAHPLLDLQRLAGNRAVQRLVAGDGSGRPARLQRMVIQRVLSPSTAAMGRKATGDLMSKWAGATLATDAAKNQITSVNKSVSDLLEPITSVSMTLYIAETEPAPGGGGNAAQSGTAEPPANSGPVSLPPSPTQQSEE